MHMSKWNNLGILQFALKGKMNREMYGEN